MTMTDSAVRRPKRRVSIFGFIWHNLDQYRRRFILVCFAGVAYGTIGFAVPVVLSEATKHRLPADRVLPLTLVIVALYLANLIVARLIRGSGEALAQQFGNHLRMKYFAKLNRQPVEQLSDQHSGYLLSLVGRVADGINPMMFSIFWHLAPGAATVCLFFYFTTRGVPVIGVLNLVFFATFVAVGTVLSRRMVPLSAELNIRRAALMESYTDFTGNIMTVRKLGIRGFAEESLDRRTVNNYKQIARVQTFHGNRWMLLHVLFGVAYLGTLSLMLVRVADGRLAVSILILFIGAYGQVRGFVEVLSETVKSFMEMRAYIRTLEGKFSTPKPRGEDDLRSWSEIRMHDVTFDYGGTGPTITIPDFCLHRGEMVCVVGASGQGKTTLIGLLADHLAPTNGERFVDDKSYEQLAQSFFDSQIALVSQETELFDMSLRDNLTLGASVPDGNVLALFTEVGLGDWFDALDSGLDTRIGEKGVRLSSGQRQRVNLLRGILLNRGIYLLDEPTAHLDDDTEAQVVDCIRRRLGDRTVLVVTHRPALRELCGRTYRIQGHRLDEEVAMTSGAAR
jgi:ABC-type multidrug transport system fused ATPase/permease subunit